MDNSELNDLRSENKRLEIVVKSLRQQIDTMELQLGMKNGQLSAKDKEIAILKSDLQQMTVRANQAERKFLDLQKQKVYVHVNA